MWLGFGRKEILRELWYWCAKWIVDKKEVKG
jgi:hypothetical protein